MCRRCGRAVWRTDAPQSRTAPPTVPRRMCSDTDPVRCSRRCRHACRVHGCRSNLNLCEANQSKAKQWEMCHSLSIPSIGSTHRQSPKLRPRLRCCQTGVTYLDRTRCHPNSYRRRTSMRCRCRNHACIPDRPCTRCTAVHASQVGIWLGGKKVMGKEQRRQACD